MSIRLEAAIALARSILDGKTDYMHQSEELYKVVAWRIIMAVQKDERQRLEEMRQQMRITMNDMEQNEADADETT
jgi:imidazoleglycerol phosphate dehydratase HisB